MTGKIQNRRFLVTDVFLVIYIFICIIAASNIKGTAGGVSRLYHMVQLVYTPMLLALML